MQVAHFEGQTHSNSTCFHISRPDSYSLLSCSLSSKNTTKKLVLTCLDRGEKLGPKHELHHTLSATPDPHMSKTVQVWLALKLMPHRKCVLSLYGLDPNQPLHHDRNAQVWETLRAPVFVLQVSGPVSAEQLGFCSAAFQTFSAIRQDWHILTAVSFLCSAGGLIWRSAAAEALCQINSIDLPPSEQCAVIRMVIKGTHDIPQIP